MQTVVFNGIASVRVICSCPVTSSKSGGAPFSCYHLIGHFYKDKGFPRKDKALEWGKFVVSDRWSVVSGECSVVQLEF